MKHIRVVALVLALAILITSPIWVNSYWIRVLTGIFVLGALVQAYNLIVGYVGYPAFGHAVFFGLGAYAVAIGISRYGLGFYPSLVCAALVSALYAMVLGLLILKLKAQYFSVATLGIMFATRELIINAREFTGGSKGLVVRMDFATPRSFLTFFYYNALVLLCLATVALFYLARGRLGYGWSAIRGDEDAALVMGVPTVKYKAIAWSIAAAIAGLAGGIFAPWLSFIEPSSIFDVALACKSFVAILMGGMGTLLGPVVAIGFLEVLSELVWGRFPELNRVLLGAIIVAITMFLPQGFPGLWDSLLAKRKSREREVING